MNSLGDVRCFMFVAEQETAVTEGFRVNTKLRRKLADRKRRIQARLDKRNNDGCERPMLRPVKIHYELADRTRGMSHGGIGSMRLLVQRLKLAEAINERLHLLKIHLPYHESDHVLNFAFNALCHGTCLDDIELRRNDEVYLDALGVRRIPDPTTAGDFCRRFMAEHVRTLLDAINDVRLKVWAEQPAAFFDMARIDMDGTLVTTDGACKAGIDINYKGEWGYHPLVVSLANTGEALSLVNRSGNRPSHDYRYFRYLTNDRESSASEIVYEANDRCDQENLHAQLKGGVR
jgi:hypothetical protein